MIYEKMPRCELNYKSSDEKYCSVCMRENWRVTLSTRRRTPKGSAYSAVCVLCSRNDMCARCLKKYGDEW